MAPVRQTSRQTNPSTTEDLDREPRHPVTPDAVTPDAVTPDAGHHRERGGIGLRAPREEVGTLERRGISKLRVSVGDGGSDGREMDGKNCVGDQGFGCLGQLNMHQDSCGNQKHAQVVVLHEGQTGTVWKMSGHRHLSSGSAAQLPSRDCQ